VPSHRTFQIFKLKKTLNHSIGEVGCCGSSESVLYLSRSNGVYTSGSSCTLDKSPKDWRFWVVRFVVVGLRFGGMIVDMVLLVFWKLWYYQYLPVL